VPHAGAAAEPGPVLHFAPIRRSRLDWLVEKAVELAGWIGAAADERTVVRLDNQSGCARSRSRPPSNAAADGSRICWHRVRLATGLLAVAIHPPRAVRGRAGGGVPVAAALAKAPGAR